MARTPVPRPKPKSKAPGPVSNLPRVLVLLGVVLVAVGLATPVATLSADKKFGLLAVDLQATAYTHSVEYDASVSLDANGGIIGGALGAGANFGGNVTISDRKVFLTGLGDFQATIGFLKGSGKSRTHTLQPFMAGNDGEATVTVTTAPDLIPWWPAGVPQGVDITVRLAGLKNATSVAVSRVWVEAWQEDAQGKAGVAPPLWEIRPSSDVLRTVGDQRTYRTQVVIPQHIGKFGIVGRAVVVLTDSSGASNQPDHYLKSFTDELGPPKILLWTVDGGTAARVALLLAGFPLQLAAVALGGFSLLPSIAQRRAQQLRAAAGMFAVLAIALVISGVDALMGLTGFGEFLTWSPLLVVPSAGGALLLGGAFLGHRPGSGAGAARRSRKPADGPPERAALADDDEVDLDGRTGEKSAAGASAPKSTPAKPPRVPMPRPRRK